MVIGSSMNEMQHQLVEDAGAGLFIAQEGAILYANIQMQRILEETGEDLLDYLTSGENAIARVRKKDGKHATYMISKTKRADTIMGTVVDATEQENGLAALIHDLKGIISPIAVYSQIARNRLRKKDEGGIDSILETIISSSMRSARMMQSLLDYMTTADYTMTDMHLNKIAEGLIAQFRLVSAIDGRYVISTQLDAKSMVRVDENYMLRAFINLANNALDAMPKGGTLGVYTRDIIADSIQGRLCKIPKGDYAAFSVSDTGKGIPEDVLAKAFGLFYTSGKDIKSYGIGLSFVMETVQRHKGYVDVETGGKGTTFTVYLPSIALRA